MMPLFAFDYAKWKWKIVSIKARKVGKRQKDYLMLLLLHIIATQTLDSIVMKTFSVVTISDVHQTI